MKWCTSATRRMFEYLHANVSWSPVIAATVVFQHPLELPFNAAFVVDDPRLAWASNNNRKVGQHTLFEADGREFWTFFAPAKYSHEIPEKDRKGFKERAFSDFIAAFGELV